ncbi:hypothetical protein HFO74_33145 [Rhizobium laguerreae]|uniref:DUF6894 domain-containing protein n=1 Tax=Rhizobium laguerreae TaxID=1076926 RepID=A0AB35FR36_9HYPH|nr:hypothetical protein [Rhizobium laguerreae]MBY3068211.1 hypothetical protein [Rhizobium laguerreae]MBY3082087.1 hypothetical protein [Rhizobium laguerreae]MBY3110496.1 hypothetical protein [Rhizobium laguerreae]
MLRFYFHVTHMDCSVLDTDGREFPDLYVATEEARENLQELVATALFSSRQRIPLGIAICSKEGTLLRDVAVDAAITEIAKSHLASASTLLDMSAASGTNAGGVGEGPGRAEVSLTSRPFGASVRPTPSVAN